MTDQLTLLVKKHWQSVNKPTVAHRLSSKPPVRWRFALTPQFPNKWPPEKDMAPSIAAYAMAHDFSVNDGIWVGSIWGTLSLDAKKQWKIHDKKKFSNLGVQGFRSLKNKEIPDEDKMVKLFLLLQAAPDNVDLRKSLGKEWCQWIRFHNVIFNELKLSEPFFKNIRC